MTAGKRRAASALFALLAAALLVAGCGGKARSPRERLEAAARAARDAGSLQARLNLGLSPLEEGKGMSLSLEGDARVDLGKGAVEALLTAMGMEVSLRYVDGRAYMQLGGTWYALEGELGGGIDASLIGAVVDFLPSLPELLSGASEVREVGERKVSGYDCSLLEVVPDLRAISSVDAVRGLARELGLSEEELLEYLEGADLSVQVYVQKGEPILRQVSLAASVELPSLDEVLGIPLLPDRGRVEATLFLERYGVDVEVEAPTGAVPFAGF